MTDTFAFAETLGLEFGESGTDGESVVRLDAGDRHLNVGGIVHGGVVATLLDTAMGRVVRDVTGSSTATTQLTVTYLDPAKPGLLEARAWIGKRGSSLSIVEAEVTQDGETVAHALATFALLGG